MNNFIQTPAKKIGKYTIDLHEIPLNDIITEYLFKKNNNPNDKDIWNYYSLPLLNTVSSLLGKVDITTLMKCFSKKGISNLKGNLAENVVTAASGDGKFEINSYENELIDYYIENFPISSFTSLLSVCKAR